MTVCHMQKQRQQGERLLAYKLLKVSSWYASWMLVHFKESKSKSQKTVIQQQPSLRVLRPSHRNPNRKIILKYMIKFFHCIAMERKGRKWSLPGDNSDESSPPPGLTIQAYSYETAVGSNLPTPPSHTEIVTGQPQSYCHMPKMPGDVHK